MNHNQKTAAIGIATLVVGTVSVTLNGVLASINISQGDYWEAAGRGIFIVVMVAVMLRVANWLDL